MSDVYAYMSVQSFFLEVSDMAKNCTKTNVWMSKKEGDEMREPDTYDFVTSSY
jgi:hypothetical protein